MSDIPPPEDPGWYADAQGAWWWWDGGTWTAPPAPASPASTRDQERTQALLMWVLYIVAGGWIAALIFYVISKDKPFVRHHAAEALNLFLVLLVPQIVAVGLLVPAYIDWIISASDNRGTGFEPTGAFWAGIALVVLLSIASYALSITAAVKASRGRWWRIPIGLHPVRGVLAKDTAPPYEVTG